LLLCLHFVFNKCIFFLVTKQPLPRYVFVIGCCYRLKRHWSEILSSLLLWWMPKNKEVASKCVAIFDILRWSKTLGRVIDLILIFASLVNLLVQEFSIFKNVLNRLIKIFTTMLEPSITSCTRPWRFTPSYTPCLTLFKTLGTIKHSPNMQLLDKNFHF
jgi:hypothetical protein